MHNNKQLQDNRVYVLFEVKPKPEAIDRYMELAQGLKAALAKTPGFIRSERFSSLAEEGKLMSMSVWENEACVTTWRNQMAHRMSQKQGHDSLFEEYRITVLSPLREYTHEDRGQAPGDSNKYIMDK